MNERYDYLEAVEDDVRDALNYDYDIEDLLEEYEGRRYALEDKLCDDFMLSDGVTGNASGSYWMNSFKAEEALCHNLDLLEEAMTEFGYTDFSILGSPESADVTIRCYLLPRAISNVLDELEEKYDIEL